MLILAEGGSDLFKTLIGFWPVAAIVVVMWFMLIRPQRQKEKRRQDMLKALAKNDRIVTIGGIHGIVKNVTESEVTVLIDEKHDVTIRINRSAVYAILSGDEKGELTGDEVAKP